MEQNRVHITLKDGDVLTGTEEHPFKTLEEYRDAILLKKSGQLLRKWEDGDALTVQIENIRTETKVLTTYNLEVANAHTCFVGQDAALVHNGKRLNQFFLALVCFVNGDSDLNAPSKVPEPPRTAQNSESF